MVVALLTTCENRNHGHSGSQWTTWSGKNDPHYHIGRYSDGVIVAIFSEGRYKVESWSRQGASLEVVCHDWYGSEPDIVLEKLSPGDQIYIENSRDLHKVPSFVTLPQDYRTGLHPVVFDLEKYPELKPIAEAYTRVQQLP